MHVVQLIIWIVKIHCIAQLDNSGMPMFENYQQQTYVKTLIILENHYPVIYIDLLCNVFCITKSKKHNISILNFSICKHIFQHKGDIIQHKGDIFQHKGDSYNSIRETFVLVKLRQIYFNIREMIFVLTHVMDIFQHQQRFLA